MKNKLYFSLVLIFILVFLSGCSNTNSLSKRIKYGNLNIKKPDNWSQEAIDNSVIEISDGETKNKDKNWGLRELEAGTYIVRVMNDKYFNYGTIVKIEENKVTEVVPDSNIFSEDKMVISKINKNNKFQINNGQSLIVKGVNLGLAKPNYFPGDVAIRESEYERWLKMIGRMNANTIRVYTVQPPEFYEALYKYNQDHSNNIYILHGAWIEEEKLKDSSDIFTAKATKDFDQEIQDIIDIIHGQAIIDKKIGHAGGIYKYDISQYVPGFIIGIEWNPEIVKYVNNENRSEFNGDYFSTDNAESFETWLAERMDKAVKYEKNKYNRQRSISFTNWVTTDAIPISEKKQYEPEESQKMVSINAENIKTKSDFKAGYFASYHAYPYYPEYINRKYNSDNYARYLAELKEVHDLPILIAEFGVPSSRGKAHDSSLAGMDQGFLSEKEQGEAIKKMFNDIIDEDLMGGLIFSWQDEYFKRTWNTMNYDIPERRPYWPDVQTNEQFFGLLSFDVQANNGIYIDGKDEGWNLENPFYKSTENNLFRKLYMDSDAENLYFRINYKNEINFSDEESYILLDINNTLGQKSFLGNNFQKGIDFIVKLSGKDNSRVLVSEDYDLFINDYGNELSNTESSSSIDGFNPIRLILSKGKLGFDYYETGKLTYGNGNPDSIKYNSLSDFYIDGKILEVRIPWALLNVKDPSQRKIMGDFMNKNSSYPTVTTEGINVRLMGKTNNRYTLLPKSNTNLKMYSWERWNSVDYKERKKESYDIVQDLFRQF